MKAEMKAFRDVCFHPNLPFTYLTFFLVGKQVVEKEM